MNPTVIKTEVQRQSYLKEVERLASLDPAPGTPEAERLELLALLIETYEKANFEIEKPDPVSAIQFRMNEQGLRQADLVQYFGSRSRVSEIMNRKRPLTLQMIREISTGLGIPAAVLVSEPAAEYSVDESDAPVELEWDKFPVKEMKRRGYFEACHVSPDKTPSMAQRFWTCLVKDAHLPLLARKGMMGDAYSPKSRYGLLAWKAKVLMESRERRKSGQVGTFRASTLDAEFLRSLVKLSWHRKGPRLAIELLEGAGISVIVEPHFDGTYLDGAAILDGDGLPCIGLTLRHDRLDNFWFTLMHEMAHVTRHLRDPGDAFLDRIIDKESEDALEREANRIARDILIPRAVWKRSAAFSVSTREAALQLAEELKISPAIVAGRIRRETGNYRILGDLIGNEEVAPLLTR